MRYGGAREASTSFDQRGNLTYIQSVIQSIVSRSNKVFGPNLSMSSRKRSNLYQIHWILLNSCVISQSSSYGMTFTVDVNFCILPTCAHYWRMPIHFPMLHQ